jgi:hypothetical protein
LGNGDLIMFVTASKVQSALLGLVLEQFGLRGYITRSTEATMQIEVDDENAGNLLTEILENWNSISLSYANNQVTTTASEALDVYMWLSIDNEGYVEQTNQDQFNPLGTSDDQIMEDIDVVGKYIVFVHNPVNNESGYLEFEVT